MNNHRLLAMCLAVTSLGVHAAAAQEPQRRMVTLDEIFAMAENGSAMLRPAITAEREAREAVGEARSGRLPDINASLSLSYIGDGFTTDRDLSDYQKAPIPHFGSGVAVTIDQPVYTGGAVTAGIKLAELKLTAARYATEMRRDNIRFRLTGYYLDIYKYSNLRSVVESNRAAAVEMLRQMQARHQQGTAIKNDITRYELLISNLELQLIKIDNILDILNRRLTVTAGWKENEFIVTPDSAILARSLPVDPEGWWQEQAAGNAPSLKLAASGVDISRRAETLVKAERMPKVALRAGWTIDGPILVEVPPINRNLSYWYVGVGVSYNLSSLYKTDKSLSRSRAATWRAQEELDVERENLQLDVSAAYTAYLEAYEELKTQTKSVELADRNYAVTSTRYGADMALITDLLDAANSKLDAEQRLVNARINIIYYYYKLLFTTGKI